LRNLFLSSPPWEPVVLAHHRRELVGLANRRRRVISNRQPWKVGKLYLTKTRFSGSGRRKPKKVRESQGGTGGQQQPGHVTSPKPKEAQTRVPKWPTSEGSTAVKEANPSKRPRDLMGPGNFWKALTNVRIPILKDEYPGGNMSEEEQDLILALIAGAFRLTPKERLPTPRYYKLEGGALIYVFTH
jgi:hypothetical protein